MQAAARAEVAPNRNKNKPLESAGALGPLQAVVPHVSSPALVVSTAQPLSGACASLGVKMPRAHPWDEWREPASRLS